MRRAMKEADKDEDNFIDFEEFKQVCSFLCECVFYHGLGRTEGE